MKARNYSFSNFEVDAILAALPLLTYDYPDISDEQLQRNSAGSLLVRNKLLNGFAQYSIEDVRIVCSAVFTADAVLSGQESLDIDPELRKDLSRNYFVYKQLLPRLDKIFDEIEKYLYE